jgi:GntR family transcriptional repressor for pyruvate dehydrogenase complex
MSETREAGLADDTPFTQIRHGRTSDELVHRLEELILDGILRDGDRLPGERELAQRFDVSRPILREALKELETRGLLVSRHGGGTFVADIVGQVFSKPLTDLISRHARATRDYLEYRRQMEGLTAELAASRATDTDRQMLSRIIDDMQAAHQSGEFEDELSRDVEFHNAICEAAHNIVLMHTMRACYRLLSQGIFYNRRLIFTVDGAHDAVMAQHVAIHDAILKADAPAARRAAEAHIDFIVETTRKAEQTGEWNRISRLRLLQRDAGT